MLRRTRRWLDLLRALRAPEMITWRCPVCSARGELTQIAAPGRNQVHRLADRHLATVHPSIGEVHP